MITSVILIGFGTVAAVLVTLSRVIGWKNILRYATVIDVLFSLGLLLVYSGSMLGMFTAVWAGLLMALTLTVLVKLDGVVGIVKGSMKPKTQAKPQEQTRKPMVFTKNEQGSWEASL